MDWEIIETRLNTLLEAGRRSELRGALLMLPEVDVGHYLSSLEADKMVKVYRILPKDISAEVFTYMEPEQQQALITSIADAEVASLIEDMFIDDAVDFLEELPAGVVKRVLQNASPDTRAAINQIFKYPEFSAGSIMTIEFAEFHDNLTVGQCVDLLRKTGVDKETIYTSYVIDPSRHLLGAVELRKLILAQDDAPITSVMETNIVSARTLDDQETVADTVRKYDLLTIPVVDTEGRLVGIVTADDIMDVIEEENTEDFEKMGGLLPAEDSYLKTSVFTLYKNRILWLLILMVSATFTGMIVTHFEEVLSAGSLGVILTASIPMLMGTGGNCGAQASTLVIRGIALGELEFRDIFRVLWREVRVAILAGATLAALNFARLMWLNQEGLGVSLCVSLSMLLTVILAKGIGCTLPLLAKKCKLDPALMASPIITTLVDACSLTILFGIASAFLSI